MGKKFERHFTKEDIQIASKNLKDVQHHYSLGKLKLKPQLDTSTDCGMANIKQIELSNVSEDVEQLQCSYIADRDVNCKPLWKTTRQSLMKLTYIYHMTQQLFCSVFTQVK